MKNYILIRLGDGGAIACWTDREARDGERAFKEVDDAVEWVKKEAPQAREVVEMMAELVQAVRGKGK